MADFLTAYDITSKNEGGYTNNPNDRGGETYAGISRKFFPNWQGWNIVDSHKPLKPGEVIDDTILKSAVKQFYCTNFWNKCTLDACDSQRIANFIYDWYVNSGSAAIKHIQCIVGVPEDGSCGPRTIDSINGWHEDDLLEKLISERISFYKSIAANDPSQSEFLNGWINRAKSFA